MLDYRQTTPSIAEPICGIKKKNMTTQEIRNIFNRHSDNIAFFIGNGINYYYDNDNLSWSNLLLDLWDNYSFDTQSTIPNGITFTEFYDALEIQNAERDNFSSILQQEVKEKMKNWIPDRSQNLILSKIREFDSPILTTNFDDLISKSMDLEFRKMSNSKFTDFYPWSCYYSDRELQYPTQGFGVWHPNGMLKYHRSIKLGLSQYMGNVERARKLIHKKPENIHFEGKNEQYWAGYNTWLHILFNKSLFIFGFGLDENEVFMRWLLIERAKYYRRFPNRRKKGWYVINTNRINSNIEGKRFFLKSVGFDVIEVNDDNILYKEIWE